MPPFLTSLLTSILTGGLGGAIQGGVGARGNRAQAMQDENVRNDLMRRAEEMMNPDYSRLIEGMSRQLTRSLQSQGGAAGQQGLMTSSRAGTLSGGVTRAREDNISAEMSAQLAAMMMQDMLAREQAAANLMRDPTMRTPSPESFNLGLDTFLGLIGGAAGGAGNTMAEAVRGGFLNQRQDEDGNQDGNQEVKRQDGNQEVNMSGGTPFAPGGLRGLGGQPRNQMDDLSFLLPFLMHSNPPQSNFTRRSRGVNF